MKYETTQQVARGTLKVSFSCPNEIDHLVADIPQTKQKVKLNGTTYVKITEYTKNTDPSKGFWEYSVEWKPIESHKPHPNPRNEKSQYWDGADSTWRHEASGREMTGLETIE